VRVIEAANEFDLEEQRLRYELRAFVPTSVLGDLLEAADMDSTDLGATGGYFGTPSVIEDPPSKRSATTAIRRTTGCGLGRAARGRRAGPAPSRAPLQVGQLARLVVDAGDHHARRRAAPAVPARTGCRGLGQLASIRPRHERLAALTGGRRGLRSSMGTASHRVRLVRRGFPYEAILEAFSPARVGLSRNAASVRLSPTHRGSRADSPTCYRNTRP
jgi:hypothetical protein